MTIFIRGNDRGSIFLHSLIIMFFLFSFLLTALELEYRNYMLAKLEYENIVIMYERVSENNRLREVSNETY